MKDKPVLSVLSATTCQGDWVTSIKSVLNQKGINFELVLVVDGPVDENSERMISSLEFEYPNIKLVKNRNCCGLTKSLNKAASQAVGSIYVRHDDDDISHQGRLARLSQLIENSNADVVASWAWARNSNSSKKWKLRSPVTDKEIKRKLEISNCLNHSTIAIRACTFKEVGGYDETFRYAQDFALYLKLVRFGKSFYCTEEPLVTRVFREQSISVKRRKLQMLYSHSALLLHNAESQKLGRILLIMLRFTIKFTTPNIVRSWKRKLYAHYN